MLSDYNTDKNINYYKAIFDNSLSALFSTIPDGTIVDANRAAVEIFGYTVEEMKKGGRTLLFDHSDPEVMSLVKMRQSHGFVKGELTGIRKNGEHFPCEMSSALFVDENGQNRTIVSLVDLSERKAIENDLFARQELLNAVVNNSNEGIAVTDKNGHFLIFNEVMVDLLGTKPIDSTTYDWAEKFQMYHRYKDVLIPTNELPIVRALGGEKVKDEIYLVKNPKKGNVYLSISASPIKDQTGAIIGSLVVDRDITNQFVYQENLKKANEDLTKVMNSLLVSDERFKYVVKATNDAIWDMDLKTQEVQWGEGYEKLFGYQLKNNERDFGDWKSKIHPDDLQRVLDSLEILIANKGSHIWEEEYRYFKSDGNIAYVYDRGYVIYDNQNNPVRMVGAMQDITQRKQYEIERTKLIDDLLQQNKNLEQFTYMISHNLRSPVANIMGCTEMLKEEELDQDEKEFALRGLSTSINKLDGVIKDMHTILRLKNDIGENKETVNLTNILEDVKGSLGDLIKQSNAVINSHFEVTEIDSVKSFIYSIFLNLISNSIKYRKKNTPPVIEITTSKSGNNFYLIFKDNGLGIDLATKGKDLFGLYKRFHSHVEGKGLGLFMVKTQIETMKGEITVKSSLNEGTEFKILLPIV
ncbi:MAG: PAS domain-containing sensor histidine kinase [Mucilaginibacter sp.]